MQDIPKSLKAPNKREGANRLHVIVMTDRGSTRRFTFSTSFFWVMGFLSLLVLGTLFALAYKLSALVVDYESARLRLNAVDTYYETRDYNRAVSEAPREASIILDRLDQAALLAETVEDEPILPWGVDTAGALPTTGTIIDGTSQQAAGQAPAASDPQSGTAVAEAEGELGPEDGDLAAGDPPLGDPEEADSAGEDAQPAQPSNPEAEAWATLQGRLPKISASPILTVDEFRLTPAGSYSYYLKRLSSSGDRLRGRAITIFAVASKDGRVTLVPDPEIDLGVPSQGYDKGGKYNIISSKVYRGTIDVPAGGQILSAQVLAWDETTRELIFQEKIVVGGPRGD